MSFPSTVAYYARTSTEEQKEKHTIQSQISALEAEIAKRGEQLVERYVDDGRSGALLDRPALEQLRADARAKRFQKLYIYSPDRLARELMLQLLVVKELRRRSVEVVFLSQQFGDSPSDHLLFQMLGAISEFERAQILERTQRGKLHKAKAGILIGSIPKFGYRCLPKTETAPARYEINPVEVGTAREIFRLFCSPGVRGLRTLATELHRLGFRNRSGNTKWAKSTLARILADSSYIGTRYYNKYMACEPLKAREDAWYRGNTSRRLRPREEWIPIRVPAIITNAQFEATQRKLARNRELSDRNAKYEYLLKGLVFCRCTRKMYGYPCHEQPRYKCADKYLSHPLPKTCCQPTVAAPSLDRAVWGAFIRTLDRPEVVAAKINQLHNDRQMAHAEWEKMRNELEAASLAAAEGEKRLVEAYAAKVIDLTQLKSQMEAMTARKESLAQERLRLAGEAPYSPTPLSDDEVRGYFSAVKEKARCAPFEFRQQTIRLFADRVTVDGTRVCIRAVLPKSVSSASRISVCYGRSEYHVFEIVLNLDCPENILIQAGPIPLGTCTQR